MSPIEVFQESFDEGDLKSVLEFEVMSLLLGLFGGNAWIGLSNIHI